MLNIQTSSLRTASNEPAASKPPGSQASASSADPAGFASLLRQTQATPEPWPASATPVPGSASQPASMPAKQAEPGSSVKPESPNQAPRPDSAVGTEPSPESDPLRSTPTPALGTLRVPHIADALRRGSKLATEPAGAGGDTAPDTITDKTADRTGQAAPTNQSATDAPVDPGLMQWLANLRGPAAAAVEASGAKGSGHSRAASTDAAPSGLGDATGTRSASSASQASDLKADADLKDRAAAGKTPLGITAVEGHFAATLAEQRGAEGPQPQEAAGISGFKDIASLATAAAAWAPPAAAGSTTSAPLAMVLATPVTAPEFAQTLGVQLSLLARDGIQHAELHLNPADMGPVSVRIVMDGTQARVDFGADVAATRQAIEAGLPELAGALRDAGFTLTGGGVSQHSRGRDSGGDASANPRSRRAGGGPVEEVPDGTRRAIRTTLLPGGLDLYA